MLSQGMRTGLIVIASLKLVCGIALTVVIYEYLKLFSGVVTVRMLIITAPAALLWGMVIPFYLNGLLGILAGALGKTPACAVYLAFCIIGILSGVVYGLFTIGVALANSNTTCRYNGILVDCGFAKYASLASAAAGVHALGWILTLTGSIMGCVGTCCSSENNTQTVHPAQNFGYGPAPGAGYGQQYPLQPVQQAGSNEPPKY